MKTLNIAPLALMYEDWKLFDMPAAAIEPGLRCSPKIDGGIDFNLPARASANTRISAGTIYPPGAAARSFGNPPTGPLPPDLVAGTSVGHGGSSEPSHHDHLGRSDPCTDLIDLSRLRVNYS